MLGDKTIVDAFDTNWEQCIMASACDPTADIFPDQRIIMKRTTLFDRDFGEFIAVYGESDYPTLITTRWQVRYLGLPILLHHMWQKLVRLRHHDIESKFVCHNGILSVVYTRVGDGA